MIIKEVKAKEQTSGSLGVLLDYLESEPKTVGVRLSRPASVGKQIVTSDAKTLKRKAYRHIVASLRFSEGTSVGIWNDVLDKVASAIGAENNAVYAVEHQETEQRHLHMVFSRRSMTTGHINNRRNDYSLLGLARRKIEDTFGYAKSNENGLGRGRIGSRRYAPVWNEEYARLEQEYQMKLKRELEKKRSLEALENVLETDQEFVMIGNRLVLYDEREAWVFGLYGDDVLEDVLGKASKKEQADYKKYEDLTDFAKKQVKRSLMPRVSQGISFVGHQLGKLKKEIEKAWPLVKTRMSMKASNFGSSLSVDASKLGMGKAVVYSNGVEGYTNSEGDAALMRAIADLAVERCDARVRGHQAPKTVATKRPKR